MSRSTWIALALSAILASAAAVFFFGIEGDLEPQVEADPEFQTLAEPLYEPTDPVVPVRLFFPATSTDVLLRTRERTIFASAAIENRVYQIVEHLIEGADDDDIFGRLPEDTRLNQVFVAEDGIAYMDFTSAISDNHPGGVLAEQATIYAIVNSVVHNIEEITRVKITVGGNERETLAGHCLLLLPLDLDISISDIVTSVALETDTPEESADEN